MLSPAGTVRLFGVDPARVMHEHAQHSAIQLWVADDYAISVQQSSAPRPSESTISRSPSARARDSDATCNRDRRMSASRATVVDGAGATDSTDDRRSLTVLT